MQRNFIVSKEQKVNGKRQTWALRFNRLNVSATVWDRVPGTREYYTARDAMRAALQQFDMAGNFQLYCRGRGSAVYFVYGEYQS